MAFIERTEARYRGTSRTVLLYVAGASPREKVEQLMQQAVELRL
jgi:hypothetical protein